jgi:nitrous oxide reductase accessory protein NosL
MPIKGAIGADNARHFASERSAKRLDGRAGGVYRVGDLRDAVGGI